METLAASRLQKLADDITTSMVDPTDESIPIDPPSNKPKPNYLPSPKQIREECRRIQQGWTNREHWRRAGFQSGKPHYELQPLRVHCDLV